MDALTFDDSISFEQFDRDLVTGHQVEAERLAAAIDGGDLALIDT